MPHRVAACPNAMISTTGRCVTDVTQRRRGPAFRAARGAGALALALSLGTPALGASVLALGPRMVQSLVAERLFDRAGRWYLMDDAGVCYTYLESPHTHLQAGRLVLAARLTARIGQPLGGSCMGGDFRSDVVLSARVHGAGRTLVLDDLRIERVADEPTRRALELALQLDPQALPRSADIDLLEFVGRQLATGKPPLKVDRLAIQRIETRAEAVIIEFDLDLSAP